MKIITQPLANVPMEHFNEWCKEFGVSSKYDETEVLHTRRKLSHIICCDNPSSKRIINEKASSNAYLLPHTNIPLTQYGQK